MTIINLPAPRSEGEYEIPNRQTQHTLLVHTEALRSGKPDKLKELSLSRFLGRDVPYVLGQEQDSRRGWILRKGPYHVYLYGFVEEMLVQQVEPSTPRVHSPNL
jgi:hypothetical protein